MLLAPLHRWSFWKWDRFKSNRRCFDFAQHDEGGESHVVRRETWGTLRERLSWQLSHPKHDSSGEESRLEWGTRRSIRGLEADTQ
jgi:hypothetical protein